MILFIGFFIVVVGLIAYGLMAKRKREKAMAELASQNGWAPLGNQGELLYQYLPQYLQGLGQGGYSFRNTFNRTTDSYDMAYQANIDDREVVFFQYQYTEYYFEYDPVSHEERETSETHSFIIINVAIAKTLPTVLLIHHNLLSRLTSFTEHIGMQSLSLEGDFNKYFDTYITPNGQIEALSLLTPDTMELVINVANGASMQITDQSITMSFENKQLSPKVIEPVIENMTKLVANILGKAQSELQPDDVTSVPAGSSVSTLDPEDTPAGAEHIQPQVSVQPTQPVPTTAAIDGPTQPQPPTSGV